jgi:hypothetical protein
MLIIVFESVTRDLECERELTGLEAGDDNELWA